MTWTQLAVAQEANRLADRILNTGGVLPREERAAAQFLRRTLDYAERFELDRPEVQRIQEALYRLTFKLPLFPTPVVTTLPSS